MSFIHVYRKIKKAGVEIKIKNKSFIVNYPTYVWEKFPKSLHKLFADSLAYISTWQLPFIEKKDIIYHFSHPPIEPLFFKMLFFSLPMNIFEKPDLVTSELLKTFYNVNFQTKFKAINSSYLGKKMKRRLKERAILLFSFGKESLLTYAFLNEFGVKVIPFFIEEPQSIFENKHKRKLAKEFYRQIGEEIDFFPLSIGKLRQPEDIGWGWDIILSQYAFVLVPYYFYYQAKYLFFGNEYSCNFNLKDKENYYVNPVFEQSVSGMQLLQNIPQIFSIKTHIGSLVEPINEILIIYILHHRYPEIGRFQMSCFSEREEAKNKRWCGVCEKCARIYIFLKALGIDPKRIGFSENMLVQDKAKYFVIFDQKTIKGAYGASGLGKDEQLLAFYLAYKRGVVGELIERFKCQYLEQVELKKKALFENYFGIYSSYTLPSSLRKKTLKILEKESDRVKKDLIKFIE
ncbi:MAG: hypothetical protein NZL96_01625 [Patescibacteria group bacterium]|nr:hypothetical protein [Patescibacteria group bacterium]